MIKRALLLFLICGAIKAQEAPLVFVSIPPQAWLVRELAGEAVQVETLMAAGANPHNFEPNSKQLRQLATATLYLTMGMPFENTLVARVAKINRRLTVTAMDAGIAKLGAVTNDHAHEHVAGHACHTHDGGDPHIWLEPLLMCAMATNSAKALIVMLPDQERTINVNLTRVAREALVLDNAIRAQLQGLTTRTWVVYHPSWAYFARRYNLTLLSVEESGKAPSARHLAYVIKEARAAGVRVVFAEPQYNKRPVQALAKQLGARLEIIDPLSEDWPTLMRSVSEKLVEP